MNWADGAPAKNAAQCFQDYWASPERDLTSRVVPFRTREAAGPVYGAAHWLNPVFVENQENTCPCCHARSWHVGRVTAECAARETVVPIVRCMTTRRLPQ